MFLNTAMKHGIQSPWEVGDELQKYNSSLRKIIILIQVQKMLNTEAEERHYLVISFWRETFYWNTNNKHLGDILIELLIIIVMLQSLNEM